MHIIPVTFPETAGGFMESKGLMKYEAAQLVFEFVTKDALVGVVKSDTKVAPVALDDIGDIQSKFGWFTSKIKIRFTSMQAAAKLPGSEGAEISIHIKRADRKAALDMISSIQNARTEMRLHRLQEQMDREVRNGA